MKYYLCVLTGLIALLLSFQVASADDLEGLETETVLGPVLWEPVITRFTIEPRGDSETVAPIDTGALKNSNGKGYANMLDAWGGMKPFVRVRRDPSGKPVPYGAKDGVVSGFKLDPEGKDGNEVFLVHIGNDSTDGVQAILANTPIRIFFDLDINMPLSPQEKDRKLDDFKIQELTVESHAITDEETSESRLERLKPLQEELARLLAKGKPDEDTQKRINKLLAQMAQPANLQAAAYDSSDAAVKDRENQASKLQEELDALRKNKEAPPEEIKKQIAEKKEQIDRLRSAIPLTHSSFDQKTKLIKTDYKDFMNPLQRVGGVLVEENSIRTPVYREFRVKVTVTGKMNPSEAEVSKTVEAAIRVVFVGQTTAFLKTEKQVRPDFKDVFRGELRLKGFTPKN